MSEPLHFPQPLNPRELLAVAHRYLVGMWSYRWHGVAVAWGVSLVACVWIYLLPDRYEASAKIYVDTDSMLRPLLRGLSIESDVMTDVAVVSRTLLARPHLERVMRETALGLRAKTQLQREELLSSLEKKIVVDRSQENIYQIKFTDPDRTIALDVARQLVNSFVEDSLGSGNADSAQAAKALKQEIDEYESRLESAEEKLKEFKRKNVGFMPDAHGDYYAQLQAANGELADIEHKIQIAEQKQSSLKQQLQGEVPLYGVETQLDAQISALKKRLNDLLLEFTDKHPDVVRTRNLIEQLQVQRDASVDQAQVVLSSGSPKSPELNPIYQSLRLNLSTTEVELAGLRADLRDRQAKVSRLKNSVQVIPEVEAELTRLNRDYDVVKSRYTEMLKRWEDLQTGKRIEAGTDQVQFRVIEPPFVATEPSGPPRHLYVAAVFGLAVALAGAVALALDHLSPVIRASQELLIYGRPVLGSITYVRAVNAISGNVVWGGAIVALVVFFCVNVLFAEKFSVLLRSVL